MAFSAIHRLVLSFQRVSCKAVIKSIRVQQFLKGLYRVTRFTVYTQPGFVYVFVTSDTGVEVFVFIVFKELFRRGIGGHLVTGGAVDFFVFSFQRKTGLAVIERALSAELVKRFFVVTLLTVLPKCVFVHILMTDRAGVERDAGKVLEQCAVFKCDFVTTITIYILVLTLEWKIGFGVIK